MKKLSIILLFILSFTVALFLSLSLSYFFITNGEALNKELLTSARSNIEIYDNDDNLVEEVSLLNKRGNIKLEKINDFTKKAFISIEDKRFFSHKGLDYKRIISATLNNIKSRSFKEGASTISQQLIKNTHLNGEKTIKRKIKEIKLTKQLEKEYSKEEILEMYLNSIYFGHKSFGLKDAAFFYFAKTPECLTVAESAMLAGIIKSPNNYSPFKNPEKCEKRRAVVIHKMYENGYITCLQKEEALKEPLPQTNYEREKSSYLEEVINEAEEIIDKDLFYHGIKIYTYLQPELQNKLESLSDEYDTDKTYLVEDATTHGIKAFYSTLNSHIKRLPGSTIKPLLVYAPAIEENIISPATLIKDEKVSFGEYSPSNFNDAYEGYISARDALAKSVNTVAVKILNSTGINNACKYMEKMNLKINEKDKSLALALGGMENGYSLKDLVSAYGTFTNEGYYSPSTFIRKITSKQNDIYTHTHKKTKVFKFSTVTLINDILKSAVSYGTAKKLSDLKYEVCAKTGTNGTSKKNTDAYSISYTSQDIIGVWLGRGDNGDITTTGGGMPCLLNKIILEYMYNYSPPLSIKKSSEVTTVILDKYEYTFNHNLIIADNEAPKKEMLKELFYKNNMPTKKSNKYSQPKINTSPIVKYENNAISIILRDEYYTKYCIIKSHLNNTEEFTIDGNSFFDADIKPNQIYTYTIIPYYKNNKGQEYILPKIKTKIADTDIRDNINNNEDKSIIDKDWWSE